MLDKHIKLVHGKRPHGNHMPSRNLVAQQNYGIATGVDVKLVNDLGL